jgi:hypothetical protein
VVIDVFAMVGERLINIVSIRIILILLGHGRSGASFDIRLSSRGSSNFAAFGSISFSTKLTGAFYPTGVAESFRAKRALAPLRRLGGSTLRAAFDAVDDSRSVGKFRIVEFEAIITQASLSEVERGGSSEGLDVMFHDRFCHISACKEGDCSKPRLTLMYRIRVLGDQRTRTLQKTTHHEGNGSNVI